MIHAIYITSSIFAVFVAGFICLSPVIYEIGERISTPVLDHFSDIRVRKANNLHYSLIPGKSFQYVKNGIWRKPPFGHQKIKISKQELIRSFRSKRDSYRIPPGGYENEDGQWMPKLTQTQYGKILYNRLAMKYLIDSNVGNTSKKWLEKISKEVDESILAYAKANQIKKNFKSPINGEFLYHQRQAFTAFLSNSLGVEIPSEIWTTMGMWVDIALDEDIFESSLHKLTY